LLAGCGYFRKQTKLATAELCIKHISAPSLYSTFKCALKGLAFGKIVEESTETYFYFQFEKIKRGVLLLPYVDEFYRFM
jgi:hypothetical protein